ncbi:hypothetical protein AVEN_235572-1 [Araneus ventricosus]|uniref:Uncharacterized protein n=1 Tax=Araneus ventricosus TaxID=182803 RepID=A0A4Y2BS48_ARAVE|nr:hypothetical protein AVEN_235572-1 [Araneus ventricosus]
MEGSCSRNIERQRLILIEVNLQKTGRTERRKILKLQDMKILNFKRDLKELINTFSETDITSENLEEFYKRLYIICEINQKKIAEDKRRNAIWWNSNREIKKRKVRALKRQFQGIEEFEERAARRLIYKRELDNYKKEILIAKQTCFKKFLNNEVKKNLFGIPYDIIKQNECNKLNLNIVSRGHGAFKTYQNRFFGKSPWCFCGKDEGTVEPTILKCDALQDIRVTYF